MFAIIYQLSPKRFFDKQSYWFNWINAVELANFKKEPLVKILAEDHCIPQKVYQANLVDLFSQKDLIL